MPLVYFLISSGFLSFYDVPAFMVPGKMGGWDIRSIFRKVEVGIRWGMLNGEGWGVRWQECWGVYQSGFKQRSRTSRKYYIRRFIARY